MISLVANGDINDLDWLKNAVTQSKGSTTIGVDGGTNYLLKADIIPDIVIGDMDSLSAEHLQQLKDNWVNVFQFNKDKDETDLELALLYVTEQPDWEDIDIHVYGAQGGRLDHEIANLMLLTHPRLQTRNIRLHAPHQTTFLIADTATIHGRAGDTVSLIPLKGDAQIAETENLKWPLINSTLKFGPARGISNVLTAANGSVTIESGLVLCIHTDSNWTR
ncbi:MAG: thiamine diphosphokinase [Anaerolineae bacterium]